MSNTISSNSTNTTNATIVGPSAEMKAILADTKHGYANKFALIQLQLAKEHKEQVTDLMEKIKELQADQKELTSSAGQVSWHMENSPNDYSYVLIPDELHQKMEELGILPINVRHNNDANGNPVYTVRIKYYEAWQEKVQAAIEKGGKNKDGYVALQSMAKDQVNENSIYYYRKSTPLYDYNIYKKYSISIPKSIEGNGWTEKLYNLEEVKSFVDRLNAKVTSMQQDIDDKMTVMQTHLGQYNSFVEGAGKAYSDLSQVGQSIAKNF